MTAGVNAFRSIKRFSSTSGRLGRFSLPVSLLLTAALCSLPIQADSQLQLMKCAVILDNGKDHLGEFVFQASSNSDSQIRKASKALEKKFVFMRDGKTKANIKEVVECVATEQTFYTRKAREIAKKTLL